MLYNCFRDKRNFTLLFIALLIIAITEMQIISFNIYTMVGLWRPLGWSSKRSKFLYSICTIIATYLSVYFMLNHMMDTFLGVNNGEDFALPSFLFLSAIAIDFKVIVVITRCDNILSVLKILQEKPCKPCNDEEKEIQEKFNRLIRSYSIKYMTLATFSFTSGLITDVMNILEGHLPFHAWVPWDYTSFYTFWLTSFQEIIATCIVTYVNVASETLLFGFCLQICAQFELLKYRLQRIPHKTEEIYKDLINDTPNKTGKLSEHIAHHICIIRLAEAINDIFSKVIFTQFFASIMVLCLCIYYMSSLTTMTDIVGWMIFTICMFVQIFVYCWSGNEVTLQSTGICESVYHMDWTLMTISDKKDLLMIMKRSRRPVRITSSFLVTLSLESYANLLKTSYSAFNILQQS